MATSITRENIDRWFELDLDVNTRTVYVGSVLADGYGGESGVDCLMAERLIKALHVLINKSKAPITIIMNNPGGDWQHGMGIYDAIKEAEAYCSCVTIKIYGYGMSMGSVIFQAGTKRLMSANSKFMIHYGYEEISSTSKIVEKWIDEGKRVNYDMENIYLERMLEKEDEMGIGYLDKILSSIVNKQKELEYPKPNPVKYKFSLKEKQRKEDIRAVLKDLLLSDTILTAEETVALGLADSII